MGGGFAFSGCCSVRATGHTHGPVQTQHGILFLINCYSLAAVNLISLLHLVIITNNDRLALKTKNILNNLKNLENNKK